MNTRPLGNTGRQISEIGMGTWGLGGVYYGPVDDADAIAAVRAYLDAGGNHVDTAFAYHKSEPLVGKAIAGYDREKLLVASKTYAASGGPNPDKLQRCVDISLRDLGTDYFDIYYIHGAPDGDNMQHALDAFNELKDKGVTRLVGASIRGPEVLADRVELARKYVRSGRCDVIQLAYSILRQAGAELFEEAREAGVAIVARGVLENGFLGGKYKPGDRFTWPDHRTRYEDEHRDRILAEIQEHICTLEMPEGYTSPAELAIKFALADPAVTSIILGANRATQVQRNIATDALAPLPADLVGLLRERYAARNDEFNPTGAFEHVPSPRE
jgi:aryl-alcohol dehydrogenase-like predicted oxidoreductase